MSNQRKNEQRNTRQKTALLGEPTGEKASGLAFSLATVVPVFLMLVVSLVVGIAGLETHTGVSEEEKIPKDWYLYVGYLLSPISFALVAAWYFVWLKKPVKATLKAQNCHWKYYLLAVALQIGLFSLSQLNTLFVEFLKGFGYKDSEIYIPSLNGFGFVAVLLTVGVLPAVFEEILFRGILMDGVKTFGAVGAVLLCGGLFSLYHQTPLQTVYQFCCGAAFALVALRAKSVLPTVLAHFINNATVLVLQKFEVESIPAPVLIPVMTVSAICLVGTLVYLIFLDKRKPEKTEKIEDEGAKRGRLQFLAFALVGIVVCLVSWLGNLAAGF